MDPPVATQHLVGRERELAALNSVVGGPRREGSALLMTGEPGIGKSALLAQVRARAIDAGVTVLSAVGAESEMHLPFGGLQQLLAPLMKTAARLPPAQRNALRTALGEFDGPRPDLFLIAESAQELVSMEALQRPVLIVADDLQWLDPQSQQIVTFLGHRSVATGVSVIGAARTGHSGPYLEAGFPVLTLVGVDDAAAEEILQRHARTLTSADLRAIHHEARGNPLALLELPAGWGTTSAAIGDPPTLSARLEHAFAGRINELPGLTKDALLVAATDSSSVLDEIVAVTSAFSGERCSPEVFAPAVLLGLVTTHDDMVRFRHPLVRSGVLQRETVVRRQAAHSALADVLPAVESFRRIWHRAQSVVGPDDLIADDLAGTVAGSLRRGAVLSAVSSLELAAQLTSSSARRGQRLLQAAEQAFEVGRSDIVGRLVREASQTDLHELDRARVLWLKEVLNDDPSGNPQLVRELCTAARGSAGAGEVGLALNLLVAAALRCWWADSGAEAQAAVLGGLDELAAAQADPRHLVALAIAAPVLRASEVMQRLADISWTAVTDGDVLRTYGMAAYAVGDFALATDLFDSAELFFRMEGRLGLLPVVLALQLHIRLDLGDWFGAAAAAEEVERVSLETGQAIYASNNVLEGARAMALRGDWASALALLAAPEAEAKRQHVNDRMCLAYQARGISLLSAGRPAEAFACLSKQYDPADIGYHLRESFGGLSLLAEAALDGGRVDDARKIVAVLATVAVLTPSPILQVNLLYARAVLADFTEAEDLYLAALAHDLSRWPWLRARVVLEYGRWLLAAGRYRAAGERLRSAAESFTSMGASRWAQKASSALDEIGAAGFGGDHEPGGDS